jgi:TatD DNase family protein
MIDSHAHLTSEAVLPHVEALLQRAKEGNVAKIVNICTDPKSLQEGLSLAKKHPWVFNAAATTPHDVEEEGELFFPLVSAAAQNKELVAIGETGLDYHYEHSNRLTQKAFLFRYFQLASAMKLPVIFHCRDAFSDLFTYADAEYRNLPAVLHCFTGTLAEAQGVLERGWYLSISGIITFKKSESLREVVKYVPLDRLLVETDTPYLAPQSLRGQQNEPAFIRETIEMIAKLKNTEADVVARITAENASKLFF